MSMSMSIKKVEVNKQGHFFLTAICNRCVVRFDHHCSWVNNCIGAYNVKLFIGYLITTALMCIHIVILGAYSLLNIVYSTGLHKAQYLDSEGKLRPVNFRVILQHLFLEHPLMVFLTITLALLWFLISGFTIYHLYLAAINQTTNERYKIEALKRECGEWHANLYPRKTNNKIKNPRFKHFTVTSAHKSKMKVYKRKEYTTNIYDNGFVSNIKEILFAFD
ncbi:probable palmitoyltransferase ZDHHC4 [Anneissia japonica]|uniref:probable palmitoyltransferase ZDHHC4 n=1 Tax=Anneissia japonica TaxID=1529436 RepID=UPI0014255527|nr:probable palmitoyltransferase ZDHHC4 [Anneissia japonica]